MDDHKQPHYDLTSGQLTLLTLWIGALLWYIYWLISGQANRPGLPTSDTKNGTIHNNTTQEVRVDMDTTDKKGVKLEDGSTSAPSGNGVTQVKAEATKPSSGPPPPPKGEVLKSVIIFGAILIFFFVSDYRKLIPAGDRVYNRDLFLFLVSLLLLVGAAFTIKPTADKLLNRDQTEEWKGWMQVMFVWYHYFAAVEYYNWIRVYIAAYVWMTGFGNFSFFWVRKDYSLWRFLKMQFRLNFLVSFLCIATNNEYMLYYICAMHTYWFVTVYVFMRVLTSWNTQRFKMAVKFAAYFVFNAVIFEISVVRDNIFKPLQFLFQYHDPRFDLMHEWLFRSRLDHWACFVGMLCAYNYPTYEAFIKYIESQSITKLEGILKQCYKAMLIISAVVALGCWMHFELPKDKFSYNETHPYFSAVPVISYIVLRNSISVLRRYNIGLYSWLGKITLETYLSQLHIYLQSNAKELLVYIPGYPLLNFSLASLIYVPVSYVLFNLTTTFSAALLPNDNRVMAKNIAISAGLFSIIYASFSIARLL